MRFCAPLIANGLFTFIVFRSRDRLFDTGDFSSGPDFLQSLGDITKA